MNIPPPIDQEYYTKIDEYLLNIVQAHQQKSTNLAIQEAGSSNLTVSDDGSWITRGRTSAHGIADLYSAAIYPKVIDVERSSKQCSQCYGAESTRKSNPEKYEIFLSNHRCKINYTGSSGSMERVLIHQMFKRSITKYNVQYHNYIGDGDAKVYKSLLEDPPYKNVIVQKIEDVNHYAKRLANRCKKLKDQNKDKILRDGLKISGLGRLTDKHIVKFKIYLSKAIRENKTNLPMMFQNAQAIFYHYYSTDGDPQHHFCDRKWCKYLQDKTSYDHNQHSIPRTCMDIIRPAFDELCSRDALKKVLNGGSQNANETFHGILWTLAPKHRHVSALMPDTAIGLAVVLYNDGYKKLWELFQQLFNSCGYYTNIGFTAMDATREHNQKVYKHKREQKPKIKKKKTKVFEDDNSDSSSNVDDDSDDYLYSIISSGENAYEPSGDELD